jgi:hypothetical protein
MAEKKKKTLKEKLQLFKRKEIIIAVLAVAIMLLIYFSSLKEKVGSTAKEEVVSVSYRTEIKNDALSAIVKLSGDKSAKIAIGWEGSEEEIIAYVTSQNGNTTMQTPSLIQSSGNSKPIVLKTIYPKAMGAVVVFKGAKDTRKKIEAIELVSTLLGISPDKVVVYEGK